MKNINHRAIFIPIFTAALAVLIYCVLSLSSCGTITKVLHKTSVAKDSTGSLQRDTAAKVKKDSVGKDVDHSIITTKTHTENTIDIPGAVIDSKQSLTKLLGGQQFTTVDTAGNSVTIYYNKQDSTVEVNLIEKAHKLHQAIDQTIVDQHNTTTDSHTNSTADTKGSLSSASNSKSKVSTTDSSKVVKTSMFSSPLFIIGIIVLIGGIVVILLFKFGVL